MAASSDRIIDSKLCKTAAEHPEILFLKVNFDENKPMCKNLNVKVLPYFHFYRGADGQLDSFSCSLAKVKEPSNPASSLGEEQRRRRRSSVGAAVDLPMLPGLTKSYPVTPFR